MFEDHICYLLYLSVSQRSAEWCDNKHIFKIYDRQVPLPPYGISNAITWPSMGFLSIYNICKVFTKEMSGQLLDELSLVEHWWLYCQEMLHYLQIKINPEMHWWSIPTLAHYIINKCWPILLLSVFCLLMDVSYIDTPMLHLYAFYCNIKRILRKYFLLCKIFMCQVCFKM